MVIDLSKTANQFFPSATTQHTNKKMHTAAAVILSIVNRIVTIQLRKEFNFDHT